MKKKQNFLGLYPTIIFKEIPLENKRPIWSPDLKTLYILKYLFLFLFSFHYPTDHQMDSRNEMWNLLGQDIHTIPRRSFDLLLGGVNISEQTLLFRRKEKRT
jgi:hypothetical protein